MTDEFERAVRYCAEAASLHISRCRSESQWDLVPYYEGRRDAFAEVLAHLAGVDPPVEHRVPPRALHLPSRPAGADEPEADPPQAVAADPSIVDSESDPSYRHGVQQPAPIVNYGPNPQEARTRAVATPAGQSEAEAERQSWLRRVQAQPIR